jgi:hypothetical protein
VLKWLGWLAASEKVKKAFGTTPSCYIHGRDEGISEIQSESKETWVVYKGRKKARLGSEVRDFRAVSHGHDIERRQGLWQFVHIGARLVLLIS